MKLFDSSPVIAILGNLNDVSIINKLIKLGYSLYVPDGVVKEILNEPEKGNLMSLLGHKIINLNDLDEQSIQKFRDRYPQLGKGEVEVILFGQIFLGENKKFYCIIDDQIARKCAEQKGLKCTGTIGLLLKLNEKGVIGKEELNENFKTLENKGFRHNFKN